MEANRTPAIEELSELHQTVSFPDISYLSWVRDISVLLTQTEDETGWDSGPRVETWLPDDFFWLI